MTTRTKLMLIDGHALVHRAFHAIPELSTSGGELTNAVFGFANIVLKEIAELRPTHVVMAMDRPSPTFRHQAYAEYKATRPSTPVPLRSQFERVRQVAAALNIPIFEMDGFEADDILGTLSLQADALQIPTTIVTGDLDALQLVSDFTHVLTPSRGATETATYDPEGVRRRYELEPDQIPEWKALVGDKSDNIPGVPGIGAKAASEMLGKYGTLEAVFEHLDELTPKRRALLQEHRDQALQSRELARIVRDVPVTLDLTTSAFSDVDRTKLINLFLDLEFRSLIERVQVMFPSPVQAPPLAERQPAASTQLSLLEEQEAPRATAVFPSLQPSLLGEEEGRGFGAPKTETSTVRNRDDLERLAAELRRSGSFAVDTETTSTDPLRAKLVGLSFSTSPGTGWYVPVGHAEGRQMPIVEVLDCLRPILEDDAISKVAHNLKYDFAVLDKHGVSIRGADFDTMIAAYLVSPSGRGLSLSALALARLGVEMIPIESLIGKGRNQISMDLVDIDTAARYAADDASITLQLRDILGPELDDRELSRLFREVEMPLVPVLARMEMEGVKLDTRVLQDMSREMTEAIGRLETSIYERAGSPFNINSTQQLGQLLFQRLNLPSGRRTKTGYSTDSEVLEGLRGKHPIVDEILEYRQLLKLKNTYIDALPNLINPDTGRIHTDFNQTIAATGRLSSSNPNLQNIPVRGDVGRRIRRSFVATKPENVLLAADYSQIELRILASMSKDERLVDAFTSGQDIHRATAAAVFNVPLDSVTSDQRRVAKVVNFGIIYGIGEQRLAYETGISRVEAAEFISNYNKTYAGVKAFMDNLRKQAAFHGFVATLLNRRRYLPDIHSSHPGIRAAAERAAINMPIQGTAADIIKVAMIRLDQELSASYPETHMVLQVHDELVFDVPGGSLSSVSSLVLHTMEDAIKLDVPLEVELKVGRDWYDMEPLARVS